MRGSINERGLGAIEMLAEVCVRLQTSRPKPSEQLGLARDDGRSSLRRGEGRFCLQLIINFDQLIISCEPTRLRRGCIGGGKSCLLASGLDTPSLLPTGGARGGVTLAPKEYGPINENNEPPQFRVNVLGRLGWDCVFFGCVKAELFPGLK